MPIFILLKMRRTGETNLSLKLREGPFYLCVCYLQKRLIAKERQCSSMFHRAFFNSIINKHQHMHFFTFKTVLV